MYRSIAGMALVGTLSLLGLSGWQVLGETASAATTTRAVVSSVSGLEDRLEQIYERTKPSVVNIRVVEKETVTAPTGPELPGFRFFAPELPQGPQEQLRMGTGSGFVWNQDGYIVTNNHVVGGADRITVSFYDGTTVEGKVVGADPDSDLAVVKVNVSERLLQPVQVADSGKLKVGQLVVAIGNPFGLQSTMTVGFISGLGRLLPTGPATLQGPSYSIPEIIQTDAAMNPGNSGGVLLDDQGQLIGVTTAIVSPVGASNGIGFAIPSSLVRTVVPALIQTGHFEHPWLGISGTSLTPDLAKAMNLDPDQRGALVVDVVPGGPADKARMRGSGHQVTIDGIPMRVGGDVIVAIDGKSIKGFDDLITYLLRSTRVGQNVKLSILRKGKEQNVEVALMARSESKPQAELATSRAWLGISGVTVTPEIAKLIGLRVTDSGGVLVQQVQQGSPADHAGLQGSYKPVRMDGQVVLIGGDVIVSFGKQPVNDMDELSALVADDRPGETFKVDIIRDGAPMQLSVTLGKRLVSSR